jgi:hypothetical protein
MGNMTDLKHDNFDDFIGRAARELDPAPAAPRDEMWAAISAARAESAAPADAVTDAVVNDPSVIQFPTKGMNATSGTWMRWAAPLAAMLIIGIALGRATLRTGRTPVPADGPSAVATSTPSSNPAATAPSTQTTTDSAAAHDRKALDNLERAPIVAVAPEKKGASLASVKRNTAAPTRGNTIIRDNNTAAAAPSARAIAFKFAAMRHFTRAQTLLVTLPSDAQDGRINEIAVRAADLLVNTRILLDSPAADDPDTRRLLDDLELILAQIATISPTRSAEDVAIIQNAITKRDVLIRLHAVTTGPRLSGT